MNKCSIVEKNSILSLNSCLAGTRAKKYRQITWHTNRLSLSRIEHFREEKKIPSTFDKFIGIDNMIGTENQHQSRT